MVIRVPIAGWENSKRCGGWGGGVERQAERSVRAARRGEIRRPKAEGTTPNIQYPTSNIQRPIVANQASTGCRTFGGRWQGFPGFIGIGASARVWGQQRTGGKSEVRKAEARKKTEGPKSEEDG